MTNLEFKVGEEVMGVSNGDGWQRIFRGKVERVIPADEDFPNQYVVNAEEIVIVCDRWHPPLQTEGYVLAYEENLGDFVDLWFATAKACFTVMQRWKDIVHNDWNPKNRDFFWKLNDLAMHNLGLEGFSGTDVLLTFESEGRYKEEEQEQTSA